MPNDAAVAALAVARLRAIALPAPIPLLPSRMVNSSIPANLAFVVFIGEFGRLI
jgi:hypothetical protein